MCSDHPDQIATVSCYNDQNTACIRFAQMLHALFAVANLEAHIKGVVLYDLLGLFRRNAMTGDVVDVCRIP